MALQGKTALITGSSRGIGRGIALKLAEHGVKTAIHYCSQEQAANETLAKICGCGGHGFVVQADVTRPEEIRRLFDRVEREFGKLDILASNARPELSEFYKPPLELGLPQWRAALDSQAQAFLLEVQMASRIMPDGGRNDCHQLLAKRTYRQLAALGGHGGGQGGAGFARSLFCRRVGETRHHRERDQPGSHRRQCRQPPADRSVPGH